MEKIILFIAAFLFGFFNLQISVYIAYIVAVLFLIIKSKKNKPEIINQTLVLSLLFSLFLPDNYLIIGILYVCAFYLMYIHRVNIKSVLFKNKFSLIFVVLYLGLSIFINGFSLIKILFSFMYLVPSFLVLFNIKYLQFDNLYIKSWLKTLLISQYIAIFGYWLSHIQSLKHAVDFDWVTGTLGVSQCNILCIICLLSAMFFLNEFINEKKKIDVFYLVISLILAICTSSIAILLMFMGIVAIFLLFNKTNLKKKIISVVLLSSLVSAFLIVTPQWMKNDIANFTNLSYVEQRVGKIKNYRTTFIEIPQKYPIQSIIGMGIGNYSSRIALTCTGEYIGIYNKLFPVEISKYTQKYILKDYRNVLKYNLSSLSTPYSSIITIQGEFGFLGTALLLLFVIKRLVNSNKMQKILVLFFVSILFIENYFEFAKVITIFALCYRMLGKSEFDTY